MSHPSCDSQNKTIGFITNTFMAFASNHCPNSVWMSLCALRDYSDDTVITEITSIDSISMLIAFNLYDNHILYFCNDIWAEKIKNILLMFQN